MIFPKFLSPYYIRVQTIFVAFCLNITCIFIYYYFFVNRSISYTDDKRQEPLEPSQTL